MDQHEAHRPTGRRIRGLVAAGVLATALGTSACSTFFGTPLGTEATVSVGRDGVARVPFNGRVVAIKGVNGKPLGELSVVAGGTVYTAKGGKLSIPDSALKAAAKAGGLVVIAPGYLPQRIDAASAGEITLLPLTEIGAAATAGKAGGSATGPGGSRVDLPAGVLTTDGTKVVVSAYPPPLARWIRSS